MRQNSAAVWPACLVASGAVSQRRLPTACMVVCTAYSQGMAPHAIGMLRKISPPAQELQLRMIWLISEGLDGAVMSRICVTVLPSLPA